MTEEKIIEASQMENQPQDKSANEHLTEEQLDNVAGGSGETHYLEEKLPEITYATMGK